MCNFWSCIVKKDGTVLYDEMGDSHEDIIEKNKLIDNTADPEMLTFARVEITPPNGDVFAEIGKWTLKIDQSITPSWWTKANEAACFATLKLFLVTVLITEKEIKSLQENHRYWIKDCRVLEPLKNVVAVLLGSSRVEARGSSRVEARGSSSVVAWGSSRVEAWGSSSVVARGSSSVVAMDSSHNLKSIKDNAVCICRFEEFPKIIVANGKIKIEVQK